MGLFDFLKPKKNAEQQEIEGAFKQMFQAAFPLGEMQVEAESGRLQAELGGRLTHDEAKRLLVRVKTLLLIQSDRDPDYLADYVFRATAGKLSRDEARLTAEFLVAMAVGAATRGSGTSMDDPVVIEAETEAAGIRSEYAWLQQRFGPVNDQWRLVRQAVGHHVGRDIDTFWIQLKDGTERTVYFDVTSFFGKL